MQYSNDKTGRAGTRVGWIGPMPALPASWSRSLVPFEDGDDFLLSPQAFDFDFYVVHLAQRGVRGVDLIRLVRRRSAAGIVALEHEGRDEFVAALEAGADMVLRQQAPVEHLLAAMAAVRRRVEVASVAMRGAGPWTLLQDQAALQAPDGTRIALSDSDLAILQCLADGEDGKVDRETLVRRLWGEEAGAMENALHAAVYRLRKRIEQAGQPLAPVHAVARVGYEFRAPLVRG